MQAEMEENLKALVDDVQERVRRLMMFDKSEEIHAYCDELQGQLFLTFESLIVKINQLQDELMAEIDSYRSRALETAGGSGMITNDIRLEFDLAQLAEEVDAFSAKCFDQASFQASERQICGEFKQRTAAIRRQMRHDTFGRSFMKLDVGLCDSKNVALPRLVICQEDVEDQTTIEHCVVDGCSSKAFSFERFRDRVRLHINGLLLLSDGDLAVCFKDGTLFVVSPQTWTLSYHLEQVKTIQDSLVSLMTQLPNGNLVLGTSRGELVTWNLKSRRHLATTQLMPLQDEVVNKPLMIIKCLDAAPSGLLVCGFLVELSSRILIVDLNEPADEQIVFRIPSPPCLISLCSVRALSNGHLAIVELDKRSQTASFVVWDLEARRKLSSSLLSECPWSEHRLLPDGQVVFFEPTGREVKMYSALTGQLTRAFHHGFRGSIVDVFLRPNTDSVLLVHMTQRRPIFPRCFSLTNQQFNWCSRDATRIFYIDSLLMLRVGPLRPASESGGELTALTRNQTFKIFV